jgi:cytochrome c
MKRLTLSALAAIASSLAAPVTLAQDAAAGKTSFNKCMACHAIGEGAKNKVGPELNGLDGRHSGTAEGYSKITVLLSPDDTRETPKYKGFLKLAS